MLTALHIENFALIDRLDLRLEPGLNVLTGETGAGKSIILDAIDAVLGGKVTQRLVRSGSTKALVEAEFDLPETFYSWLVAQADLPAVDGPLALRRELSLGKTLRSRSFLNGSAVTRPQMEVLRQKLVEITAQGQTVLLGSGDRQRDWLDGFGGAPVVAQLQTVAAAYAAATAAKKRLEARRRADQQRRDQLELLQMHRQDLEQAQLEDPDELEKLTQEHQRLNHSVDLQQNSYQVYQILYEGADGNACADLLGKAEAILMDMERYDPAIAPTLALVSEALTQVEEAGRAINAYGASVEADPQRLEEVEERLRQLKGLCRRYNRTLPELVAYRDEVVEALAELSGEGQSIAGLEAAVEQSRAALEAACAQLTALRRGTAQDLETRLVRELKPLAMERVQFRVDLTPVAPTASGADGVRFLFSPNPGEPLQPLAETASGGEMSRFLLALKACFSQIDPVGTLVFDEIDVGVSGRVAQAIAEKLYHLGRQHQVLCVTHQPMVAALADAHYRVGKQVVGAADKGSGEPDAAGERTVVRVVPLSELERRQELAQLAGGESHQQSLSFAAALLSQANSLREKL